MGDVDGRDLKTAQQSLDLDAGLATQLGIQVGERLVEEEERRLAHQGAGNGQPLLLSAREGARPARQQFLEADAHDLSTWRECAPQPLRRALLRTRKKKDRLP